MISVQFYVKSLRDSSLNMREMGFTLRSRVRETERLVDKLRQYLESGHFVGSSRERLVIALEEVRDPMKLAREVLRKMVKDLAFGKPWLWVGAKFVLKADVLMETLEKVEKAVAKLRDEANDLLPDVPKEHEVAFRSEVLEKLTRVVNMRSDPTDHEMGFRSEIMQEFFEMRNEMMNLKESNARMLHEVRDLLQDSIGKSQVDDA